MLRRQIQQNLKLIYGKLRKYLIETKPTKFVSLLTTASENEIRYYYQQLHKDNKEFLNHINSQVGSLEDSTFGLGEMKEEAELLYILVRILKPEIVVETGVASGKSSAFILQALYENKDGFLYSVDLPMHFGDENLPYEGFNAFLPNGKESGWLIPDYLKQLWNLKVGKSREKLPGLLDELGKIDVFLHDSAHIYETMFWEYETVWPHINRGGGIVKR